MPENYRDFGKVKVMYHVEGILENLTPLIVGSGEKVAYGSIIDKPLIKIPKRGDKGIEERPYIPGSSLKGVFRSFLETLPDAKEEVIEGIFGSQELASHVVIYDSYPKGELKTFIKRRTAIDDRFGTVIEQKLFTEELVAPGGKWKFEMDIININLEGRDERAKYLRALLRALTLGLIQVGGGSSIGYGKVILKINKILKIKFEDLEIKEEEVDLKSLLR